MTRPFAECCDDCGSRLRWVKTADGQFRAMNPVRDPTGWVAAKAGADARYVGAIYLARDEPREPYLAAGYVLFRPHPCRASTKAPTPELQPSLDLQ